MKNENTAASLKNAAFAAGDVLMRGAEEDSIRKSRATAIQTLLDEWFTDTDMRVAVYARGMDTPITVRKNGASYIEEDFAGDLASYIGPCFVIDSLCGQHAFERGLRGWCVSIAYISGGQLQAAAVYDPVHVELFHAVDGLGAYLNGRIIRPSDTVRLMDASVTVCPRTLRTSDMHALRSLADTAQGLRTSEAPALALCEASCGRTDAAVISNAAYESIAAGLLIAREAGIRLVNFSGGDIAPFNEHRSGVAAARKILSEALTDITRRF